MRRLHPKEVIKETKQKLLGGNKMEGILKVTPEKLMQVSGEFDAAAGKMKTLTGEMLSLVKSLGTYWLGEAAAVYGKRFDLLSPDMDKLYRMIQEHAADLLEMSRQYQAAEGTNTEQGNSLQNGVVV